MRISDFSGGLPTDLNATTIKTQLENGNTDTQGVPKPATGAKPGPALTGKAAEADKVAREFETLFMDLVMKSMRQTAKPEEQSNATEIYQGMLDGEYTKSMTDAKDFGIRSLIFDWMKNVDPDIKGQIQKEGQTSLSKIQNDTGPLKNALASYKLMNQPR